MTPHAESNFLSVSADRERFMQMFMERILR